VLVIHTDIQENLTKKYPDEARQAARDVDNPGSEIGTIVSVLTFSEGWDCAM
jgi:hypothetical protein